MFRFFMMILLIMLALNFVYAAESVNPVAWWDLDSVTVQRVEVKVVRGETFVPREVLSYVGEKISNKQNELFGKYYKIVQGISGQAVLLDGNTAYIEMPNDQVPKITSAFTIEAWVSLGAYPKNWCPVVDHQQDMNDGYFNGYFLGVDALGRLMFRIATKGKFEDLLSVDKIPLNSWTHLSGVYSPTGGMKIYINGKQAGAKNVDAIFSPVSRKTSLLIGRSRAKYRPYGTIRPNGTMEVYTFLDGILDEIKIYDSELTASAISKSYSSNLPKTMPDLPLRVLPAGPDSLAKFTAVNTTLPYYPAWDAPWPVADNADVLVGFDETPCRVVFWRGTNYLPHWVTENKIWFNNGFNEGWNEHGSCEPMSDKQCRHASAKIIESNEARVVVQWRYALVDNWYQFAFVDPVTEFGDWTNETFTIYPDMIAVREDVLLSNAPRAAHEWQETMMVMSPGQRPDEVLEYAALTLANMNGETHTYSWEKETPPHLPSLPENPNIQLVNTKSKYKPFSIIRPQDDPGIDIYSGEIRREVCVFPWWNHWPVAMKPTDGRYAMFADHPSHASLSHWEWDDYQQSDRSMTKIMLHGLTDRKIEDLIPIAKSWSNPPAFKFSDASSATAKYDPVQRAYVIDLKKDLNDLDFEISANETSPVFNPALVIKNWGEAEITLTVNGNKMERGKNFRYGQRDTLEGTDLVVWFRTESTTPVKISLNRFKP